MGPQIDRLVHAGEFEMGAVELSWTQIVVGVVVDTNRTFGAIVLIAKFLGPVQRQ